MLYNYYQINKLKERRNITNCYVIDNMFTLGVRLWTGKDMVYPSRFSVLIDFDTEVSSMRTYIDNTRIDSKTYMMLTPGMAINGEIYEGDAICDCNDDNLVGIVEFNSDLGAFVAFINDKPIYISANMNKYEIIGNIYEDWEDIKGLVCNFEKFEKIIEEANKEIEETKKQAELKTKKDEKKEQRDEVKETSKTENEELKNIENEETLPDIPENEELPDIPEIDVPENPLMNEFQESELSDFGVFDENSPLVDEPVAPDFDFKDDIEDIQTDIKLFVDGQGEKALSNGSYSYIMQCGDYERTDKGAEKETTKQRMELQAVISALAALNAKCNIKIYTTSQYLIVPFIKGWITRWRANNWKKESNEEVKNKDLWEQLYDLYSEQNVEWEFIKPGSSIVEILRCIDLSKEALVEIT